MKSGADYVAELTQADLEEATGVRRFSIAAAAVAAILAMPGSSPMCPAPRCRSTCWGRRMVEIYPVVPLSPQ